MPHLILEMWSLAVLAAVLVAAAVSDVRSGRIPNAITYPAVAVGLIAHTLTGGLGGAGGLEIGLLGSLAGLAAGFVPLLLAWKAGGIGGGDAKLMGAVGALTGWRFALDAMFFGFAVAVLMALCVMVRRRILKRTLLRVGRFLYLLLGANKPGDPATGDSPKIPFGLALCIGSAIALAYVLWRGGGARKLVLGI